VAIFFSILIVLYCLALTLAIVGWLKNPVSPTEKIRTPMSFISVLVPIRNECENIFYLLDDLNIQDYPASLFEVIVVDDHSEDGSFELINASKENYGFNLKLIRLPGEEKNISTKKKAIQLGVELAQGEHIMLTDGDCRVPKGWISSFSHYFAATGANFAAGMVSFHDGEDFFQRVQAIEFSLLTGVGGAFFKLGAPFMCNAANMAFSRRIFRDVGGYENVEHIVSGDDGFLLEKFIDHDKRKVGYLQDKNAMVSTLPQKSFMDFIHQRKRWASKWRFHKNPMAALVAIFVFIFHATLLLVMGIAATGHYLIGLLLVQLVVKTFIDYVFLKIVHKSLGKKLNFVLFIAMEAIYPLYAVFFGIIANRGGFNWKGRAYQSVRSITKKKV
jgi:poly-beta-1,6-N-acetyl-D-glucosamine synthase